MAHVGATTKLSKRNRDRYNTPEGAARCLIHRVPILQIPGISRKMIVVEPCSGTRSISRVIETAGATVVTNDIDRRFKASFHWDMLDEVAWKNNWGQPRIDWTITNPPFKYAAELIPLAYEYSKIGIAMFLRLSYPEPCDDRAEWLAAHDLSKQLVLPRISFRTVVTKHEDGRVTTSKTDNMTCAWFVWYKGQPPQISKPIEIVTKREMEQYAK